MRSQTVKNILKRTPKSTHIFVRKCADITLRVNELIAQKEPYLDVVEGSEVKKWIDGQHTLSLEDISKLEYELGATILEVPKVSIIVNQKKQTTDNSTRKNTSPRLKKEWKPIHSKFSTLVV